jgi:IclR family transcriptional regulator, acetate operon repressor
MKPMARRGHQALGSPTAKIMAVLETVAKLGNAPVSLVAKRTGLPVPSAYRICIELERLGHLQRVPGTRNWTVARPLVELAASALASAATSAPAEGLLAAVAADVGEMTSFAVQVANQVVYVASAEVPQELTLSFRAGRSAPLFCTSSGRLFLARLSDALLDDYLATAPRPAFTRHTVTDSRKLRAEILRVRSQGFALTCQEYIQHVVGAAVPVESDAGYFFGALSIAAPDVRVNPEHLRKLVPALTRASKTLARSLGRAALLAGAKNSDHGAAHRHRPAR